MQLGTIVLFIFSKPVMSSLTPKGGSFCKLISWGCLSFEQKTVFLCQEMQIQHCLCLIITSSCDDHKPLQDIYPAEVIIVPS